MPSHLQPGQLDYGRSTPQRGATPMLSVLESDPLADTQRRGSGGRDIIAKVVVLVLLVGLVYAIFTFVLGFGRARNAYMAPSIREDDFVCFMRLDHRFDRDDIVVYRDGESLAYARVVAVAGDEVSIQDGAVFINGEPENRSKARGEVMLPAESTIEMPLSVGEGEVFVLFDTRSNTGDSRMLGCLKEKDCLGSVISLFRTGDHL